MKVDPLAKAVRNQISLDNRFGLSETTPKSAEKFGGDKCSANVESVDWLTGKLVSKPASTVTAPEKTARIESLRVALCRVTEALKSLGVSMRKAAQSLRRASIRGKDHE